MFTGIVQAVGRIAKIEPLHQGVRLTIETGKLDLAGVCVGDSICVSGVCLTATAVNETGFSADVSRETLGCTVGLGAPGRVNLEKSLRVGDSLGGHIVSGHVDGIGEVTAVERAGESILLRVRVPQELARYVARKGSVALDGVSLTVNRVEGDEFEVNLIPHTLAQTTFERLAAGAPVNLEVDPIARYVERMLAAS